MPWISVAFFTALDRQRGVYGIGLLLAWKKIAAKV